MFSYQRKVFLRDTDATGVIYFGSMFQYSLEAFESLLSTNNQSLRELLSLGYLFPVVHAEADYKAPLKVGDDFCVQVFVSNISERSFTVESILKRLPDSSVVGTTKIVHAFLLSGQTQASTIPEAIVSFLQAMQVEG